MNGWMDLKISMDGPNINLKFLNYIAKDCVANEQHELIFIGACGLDVIHGAFRTGAESTDLENSLSNPP